MTRNSENDDFNLIMDDYFRLHPITAEEGFHTELLVPFQPNQPPPPSKKRKRDDDEEKVSDLT